MFGGAGAYGNPLYYVISAFCVDTLVAKQSKAGERTGWNQEEFSAVADGLPENMERVSEMSCYDYLENYMRLCGSYRERIAPMLLSRKPSPP